MTASLTLCLDTSDGVAVALLRAGEQIAGARSDETRRHMETLTPLITACLQQAEVGPAQVTEVAVGTGPAPFTGLRVGLITARTFAEARGIPALGVSSLEVIAASAAVPGTEILVATDARRREVYWGRYRRTETGVQTVAGPGVATAGDLAAENADLIDAGQVVGAGVRLYPDQLAPGRDQDAIAAAAARVVDAAALGRLALERAAAGVDQPTQARYLRSPDIAPPSRRKRAS